MNNWSQKESDVCLGSHILHSWRWGLEHLSDLSKVTHGAGDKQHSRSADFQSCVLSVHLVKQKLVSHEGMQVKQTPSPHLVWFWLQTAQRGAWLQCSLALWSAQSKHRASDREAHLAQKGPRLCKALRVFCLQLGLYCCVTLHIFLCFSGLQLPL